MHQRDYRRRERVAEQKGSQHRHGSHDVEPNLALPETSNELDNKVCEYRE